nr:flagellar biosynthetic protein FliR [Yoonia maritima]
MIAELSQMVTLWQNSIWTAFVVFVRISAMMAVMPAFGDQPVPVRVRVALSFGFTCIVAPSVFLSVPPITNGVITALATAAPEVLSGLFFGLFLRFFIMALQISGAIAAQSTSLSQIFGGSAGADAQPAIGHLLVVSGTALAVISGLHVQLAGYMIQTYELVPIGTMLRADTVVNLGLDEVRRIFELGFSLAAPFLLASLVYNVVLGVINRAMPQLMVSFVGAPAITAGGLLLLLLSAPIMLALWHDAFSEFMAFPFRSPP